MIRALKHWLGVASLLTATAGAVSGQAARYPELPTGVRLGIGLGMSAAILSGDPRAIVNAAGTSEPGGAIAVQLGYDFKRLGFSLGMDGSGVVRNRREELTTGSLTLVSVVAHWRIEDMHVGRLQPHLTAGFIYQGLSTHDIPNAALPPEADGIAADLDGATSLTMSGPGMRLGVGGGWAWHRNFVLATDLTADLVSYRKLASSGEGDPITLRDPGITLLPRLLVSLQFSPFTKTR